jgi:hypothetical protein
MKFIPGLHTTWHMCVFHDQYTLTNDVLHITLCVDITWDEVPTMVEIAIFWFQIHITNGLNFMYRKWHIGNQYMVKSNSNNSAPSIPYRYLRAWTLLVIKTRQLLSERESQSAMIICRVCARRFFQFPVMFTNNMKWRSTSWLTMFN